MVSIPGTMEENTKDTGKTITCTEKEPMYGQIKENTKVSISTTKSMDLEPIHILMEEATLGNGRTVSKTERVYSKHLTEQQREAFGKKERE